MDINTLFLQPTTLMFTICSTFLFFFLLYWLRRSNSHSSGGAPPPPEAGGGWPLIGHLHLLGGAQSLHVTLGKMADKYGPIFTIRLGVHRTLIVSNSEMAKQCFTVNDKAFASRPKSVAFEVLGYNFSMIGFSPYGSYWRTVRKIATLHVLSTQRLEMLKQVMVSEVKTAVKESYEFWLKKKNEGSSSSSSSSSSSITEMKEWFGNISLNVVFRTVVGKRFEDGEDEEENQRIKKALRELFDLSGSFVISDALPFLRWLDLDGREKEMKKNAKELDAFARVWLHQHKQNKKQDASQNDFMDVLLSTVDDFDGRDADTTIKATSLALILAATDTTTGTLTWVLSLLLNNPEVLKKTQQELDTHIGREKMAMEYSDWKKLEYLQAVIKETLRLYPAAPLNLPHESFEDCIVGGYHVPAGTRLMTNISKLQRDPMLYSDPLEFRPERFLTTHKDVDLKGQHFELIPFGSGRRMCPGISFGLELMQMTLATLLHGFDLVTPDGGPVDMTEQVGLTTIKASPLQVILTPRLSPQVYAQI